MDGKGIVQTAMNENKQPATSDKQQAKCQEDMPSVKKSEPERKMEREERVDTTATKAATKATFDQNLVKATKQQQPLLYDFFRNEKSNFKYITNHKLFNFKTLRPTHNTSNIISTPITESYTPLTLLTNNLQNTKQHKTTYIQTTNYELWNLYN